MAAWINFSILLLSILLFSMTYLKSLRVSKTREKFGKEAYIYCTQYRLTSAIFMIFILICYVVCCKYPLQIDLPYFLSAETFPWRRQITMWIFLAILVPFMFVFINTMKAGGEALMFVSPNSEIFLWGPYRWVRHPGFLVEIAFWIAFSLLLDSPFLFAFSMLWIPIYVFIALEEEKELIKEHGETYINYKKHVGFFIPKSRKKLHGEMADILDSKRELEPLFNIKKGEDEGDYVEEDSSDDIAEDDESIDPNDHFNV